MAATSLRVTCADHAERALRAGFAMIASVRDRNAQAAVKWHLRIGLHLGRLWPAVSGGASLPSIFSATP